MHSGPGISNRLTVYLTEVTIPAKYSDFAEVFLEKSAAILLKRTDIIEHTIKLQEGKQPPYWLIYSLNLVEFKNSKELHWDHNFIYAGALIFFV